MQWLHQNMSFWFQLNPIQINNMFSIRYKAFSIMTHEIHYVILCKNEMQDILANILNDPQNLNDGLRQILSFKEFYLAQISNTHDLVL